MNIKSLFHYLTLRHESEKPVRDFLREKTSLINIAASAVLQIMIWYLFFSAKPAPADMEIVLNHNIYFGITLLGPWRRLAIIPLLGLTIFLVNLLSAYFLFHKNKLAAGYLLYGASLAQVFLAVAMLVKILVNV